MTGAGGIPTERQTQRAILAMAKACFPDVLLHHSPNGAHLAGDGISRFKQAGALLGDGMKKGFFDLIAIWSGGIGFIEVKRPKLGKLSDEQKAIHKLVGDMGWPIATVTGPESILFLLTPPPISAAISFAV